MPLTSPHILGQLCSARSLQIMALYMPRLCLISAFMQCLPWLQLPFPFLFISYLSQIQRLSKGSPSPGSLSRLVKGYRIAPPVLTTPSFIDPCPEIVGSPRPGAAANSFYNAQHLKAPLGYTGAVMLCLLSPFICFPPSLVTLDSEDSWGTKIDN